MSRSRTSIMKYRSEISVFFYALRRLCIYIERSVVRDEIIRVGDGTRGVE